jgi:tripartite-type tricarboxylate transporter receptor subunit TctC
MTSGRRVAGAALGLALAAAPALAPGGQAETFPSRPIRIVVPYAAGGVNDVAARLLQPGLQAALGQPIVIDNRSGANGAIGSAAVAKAMPDGYTLLIDNESHAVNPAINPKLPYDTAHEFAPVTLICTISRLFVINAGLPVHTLAAFVALARAQPGALNYAIAASPVQLAMELFDSMAGITLTSVTYRGGAPAMQAMLSNETQITLVPLAPAASYLRSGQLRALAIAGPRRSPALPDVPTVAEAGYPAFDAPSWIGVLAPAGTPPPIIARLHDAIAAVLAKPDVGERFEALGMDVAAQAPESFGRFIAGEIAKWTKVARDHNITVEE